VDESNIILEQSGKVLNGSDKMFQESDNWNQVFKVRDEKIWHNWRNGPHLKKSNPLEKLWHNWKNVPQLEKRKILEETRHN